MSREVTEGQRRSHRRFLRALPDDLVADCAERLGSAEIPYEADRLTVEAELRAHLDSHVLNARSYVDLTEDQCHRAMVPQDSYVRWNHVLRLNADLAEDGRGLELLTNLLLPLRDAGDDLAELHADVKQRRDESAENAAALPDGALDSVEVQQFASAALLADRLAPDGYCDPRDPTGPHDPAPAGHYL